MVASITIRLNRFKTEWATPLQPEAMIGACEEAGCTSWRDRVVTPGTTIQLVRLQILHGNTACSHLPHLSGFRFSASASGHARTNLSLDLVGLLLPHDGFCPGGNPLVEPHHLGRLLPHHAGRDGGTRGGQLGRVDGPLHSLSAVWGPGESLTRSPIPFMLVPIHQAGDRVCLPTPCAPH
jgi:hypothetical protein